MSRIFGFSSMLSGFLSIALVIASPAVESQAYGHHFGRHHGWHGGGWNGGWGGSSWGAYGMGGGFRHSAYAYPSFGFGFPSYSYTSLSIGFPSYRSYYGNYGYGFNSFYYNPVVYRPVVYTPVYYRPIYYRPIQYCPIQYYPIQYSAPVTPFYSAPVCATPVCAAPSTPVKYAPSEAWTDDAIALIDAMAKQGGASEGYAACKQLMKTHSSLPGHFYTRAAVLAALTNQESSVVLSHLAAAKERNANKEGSDLPGGSIRSYVAKIPNASMDSMLNQIAAKALSKPTDRKSEFNLLANLLTMDGQQARASRFQSAVDTPAIEANPKLDTTTFAMAR